MKQGHINEVNNINNISYFFQGDVVGGVNIKENDNNQK